MGTARPSVRFFPAHAYWRSADTARGSGKLKFNFKGKDPWAAPFITLLQGRTNEIILRDPDQLQFIADAAEEAMLIPGSDSEQLEQLKKIIEKKKGSNGTKAQLKPAFSDDGACEKVAVVVKWGGEVRAGSHLDAIREADLGDTSLPCSSPTRLATKLGTWARTCARVRRHRFVRAARH